MSEDYPLPPMRSIADFTADEVMDLLDIATDALEELAGKGNSRAAAALEQIAEQTREFIEGPEPIEHDGEGRMR